MFFACEAGRPLPERMCRSYCIQCHETLPSMKWSRIVVATLPGWTQRAKNWKISRFPSGTRMFKQEWNFKRGTQQGPFLWGIHKVKIWGTFSVPDRMTWWTFRIFFIFFSARGGGRGVRAVGRGAGRFLLKIPGGGGGVLQEGEGPRGREGVCSELGNLEGGGLNIFLFGPKCPPRWRFHEKTWNFNAFKWERFCIKIRALRFRSNVEVSSKKSFSTILWAPLRPTLRPKESGKKWRENSQQLTKAWQRTDQAHNEHGHFYANKAKKHRCATFVWNA